jgi:protein-disulfide isomerase
MKLQVVAIALAIGCAGRQDTSGLSERIRQLETEVAALRSAPAVTPAPAPPKPKPKPRRPDELGDRAPEPTISRRVAELEEQVRKLERSNDEAWTEVERVMFGDVRALDAKLPNQARVTLKPDVSYSVPVTRDHPSDGDDSAKVTWVIGIEVTEPYTRRLLEVAKAIRAAYGKELRIVYRHFVVHDYGVASAMALCAANRQGKFPEAIAELVKLSTRDRAELRIGGVRNALRFLDRIQLDTDVTGSGCKKHVRDDHLFAMQFGMSGTPFSFINGRSVTGAQPEEAFRKVIDEELAKADAELGTRSSKGYYDKLVKRGAKP